MDKIPRPQAGTWTLTAPDGRSWQAPSPIQAVAAEQHERIPPAVALERIFAAAEPAKIEYSKLPVKVQQALDALDIEDSDNMTAKEVFEAYCQWHGILGWNLWDLMEECKDAEVDA